MTKEERREYQRKYRAEHREEYKAYMKKYNTEHREEHNVRMRKRYSEHREERREYMKNRYAEHREEYKAYMKKYYAEHREERKARQKKCIQEDLNKNGVTKNHVRLSSRRILEKCHSKLPNYEIHHCFSYEDPNKFIYIPRELHLKIHQFLRDNNIPAHIDHFNAIRELISSYTGYTYIRA